VVLFGQDVTGGDDERDRPLDDLECSQGSSMSGDIGVDAGDPVQRVREEELVRVGEIPVERSADSFCCFTWINGVDLRYGFTADQGWTGREDSTSRLWRPARALGTHAKRGPSTGHSAVGLRQLRGIVS
jgi:hypothetical protein